MKKSIFQGAGSIKLFKYLHQNQNIDPFNKIMIAKNIALAYQEYRQMEIIYGDFDPANCLINPETLSIYIADNNKSEGVIFDINNKIQNIAYSAPERLNQPQDGDGSTTLQSGEYSTVAIIVDLLTGIFPPNLDPVNGIYKQFLDKEIKKNPNFMNQMRSKLFATELLKQRVIEHYFGKEVKDDELKGYDLNVRNIDTTKFCAASHDRINALKNEIKKENYLLSYEMKQRLINVCKNMLFVNPNSRPTSPTTLLENLKIISTEFTKQYLNHIVNFIATTMSTLESKFPGITDKRLNETLALNQMVLELEAKEVITKKQIINLHKKIAYSLQLIAKDEQLATYLDNVNKEIFSLEKKISKSLSEDSILDDDFVDIPLTEDHFDERKVKKSDITDIQSVPELLKKNAEILSKSNLEENDFKSFKERNNDALKLLTETYKGRDFFVKKINKLNIAMNYQPYVFRELNFKK